MKDETSPAAYPTGVASIPLVRGWQGLIVIRRPDRELDLGWTCPHNHLYRDTAEHCAGPIYRRWLRTGIRP